MIMTKPFAILWRLFLLTAALGAPLPPIRSFEGLSDVVHGATADLIPTELTIGRPLEPEPTRIRRGREHPQDDLSSALLNTFPREHPAHLGVATVFSHSRSSPFQYYQRGSISPFENSPMFDITRQRAAAGRASDDARQAARFGQDHTEAEVHSLSNQHTPQLDAFFGDTLRDHELRDLWKLPQDVDYVPSEWFDRSYRYLIGKWMPSKEPRYSVRHYVPPFVVRDIVLRRMNLFKNNPLVFKVRIPASPKNDMMAGDVFVRVHDKLPWPVDGGSAKQISVWKTSGAGSRLALLGFYRSSLPFLRKVLFKLPNGETFKATNAEAGDVTFLAPVPGSVTT